MEINMLPKAVFVEKDGILIENLPCNMDPACIKLSESTLSSLHLLHDAGYLIVLVSNQAGIAHGRYKEDDLLPVEAHLQQELAKAGIPLAGFYYCPHHPDGKLSRYTTACFCRMPSPGLLFRAARELGLNLAKSWIIGDILNDIEAGRRADCRTILINNGNETEWKLSVLRQPHHKVKNLLEAAEVIVNYDNCAPAPVMRTNSISISAAR
jgi:D,D-heptose 1,7-bisphosphate phosphatase